MWLHLSFPSDFPCLFAIVVSSLPKGLHSTFAFVGASLSLVFEDLLAALACMFAMLFGRIVTGFAISAFRAFVLFCFPASLLGNNACLVWFLAVIQFRAIDFEPLASISVSLDFASTLLGPFRSAFSLPLAGLSCPFIKCRVCASPAIAFLCLHVRRVHQNSAPKCPKQCFMRQIQVEVWVPFGGFPIEFDALKGFPGEGPLPQQTPKKSASWSLATANIGSLKTSSFWKSNEDTVYCLQETRVGRNNIRTSQKQVQATNRTLFCGELLSGIIRSDGRHITMHGGTAIIAADSIARAFDPQEDSTKLFAEVLKTKRANACWVQVSARVRALVFSVYAKTGASASPEILESNNSLLDKILLIAAQFGDIPIILAGDLQLNPLSYPSIAHAVHFEGWADPLASVDAEGRLFRPLTFSLDGTFTGEGEGCSSIDAVILNRVAFAALHSIEVVALSGLQHRPIRALFNWEPIHQIGEVHAKFAALDHSGWNKHADLNPELVNQQADDFWAHSFESAFESTEDFATKWHLVNNFCLQTLLNNGSQWGFGARKRGFLPSFVKKRICPGQLPNGTAATNKGSRLYKTLRQLWELETRMTRPSKSLRDAIVFQRTVKKVWHALWELHAPMVWDDIYGVTLVDVFHNVQWVLDEIHKWEKDKKCARISAWRSRMKESAQGSRKHIFHHLKNKCVDEPANLVLDADNNIIFQPRAAIESIAHDWDSIYSANALRHDPKQMLSVIWPYLDHDPPPFDLPPLTGADIAITIKQRKPIAAPGLDGWRTCDLQRLPRACCDAIASFFRALEDDCNSVMPDVLTRAKQVILNKPGPSSPLNKRLITILSPMLLAYTGTRFRQLQAWQRMVLPRVLCGGIQNRDMSDVSVGLRLEIDEAQASNNPLVGIKLDQSKCFDRIVPDFAAALFLALGLPKGLVNAFVKMYASLKRHLSYRGWISSTATTAANGVAQGCSLSLIAINVHMAVWARFMALIPHVSARVFIDDAYLWVRLAHVQQLETAIAVTKQWNLLIGQKLNTEKCSLWATNAKARKAARKLFPSIPLVFEFDALGAKIYTTQRDDCLFSEQRAVKICIDARNIAALPLTTEVKGQLIASKVIPQCSFAADISSIPKLTCAKIENEIANAIWGRRPHWRARMLVFTFLCNPCFVHPKVARAYVTVCNMWRYVHRHPEMLSRLRTVYPTAIVGKHTLLAHFRNALKIFHCAVMPDLTIGIGSSRFSILDVSPKDIRGMLHALGRQYCYESVNFNSRKDVKKPTGLVDYSLSTIFKHAASKDLAQKSLIPHFDAQIVGCTITNDRRAAAGFVDSAACRFCLQTKESLLHIIKDCPAAPSFVTGLEQHELGPNFCGLGIVEHPAGIASQRLKISKLPALDESSFDPHAQELEWFTDGSVLLQESYWVTSAAYAIFDKEERLVSSGPVCHPSLAAYTAELFAIAVAVTVAKARLRVFTDCKTVVDLFGQLIAAGEVPVHWSHSPIWEHILRVWKNKVGRCQDPVVLTWMPAHTADHLPFDHIDRADVFPNGLSGWHIRANRLADEEAKRVARAHALICIDLWPMVKAAARSRRDARPAQPAHWLRWGCKKGVSNFGGNQSSSAGGPIQVSFPSMGLEP